MTNINVNELFKKELQVVISIEKPCKQRYSMHM